MFGIQDTQGNSDDLTYLSLLLKMRVSETNLPVLRIS